MNAYAESAGSGVRQGNGQSYRPQSL